jgi:hypothetical protein
MEIITRAQAKTLGLKRYFTNKPCKYNHITTRFTSTGQCHECMYQRKKKFDNENRELVNQQARDWYQENKEICIKRTKTYQKENRQIVLRKKKIWRENNKDKRLFYQRKREARKKNALPKWANLDAIKEIYMQRPEGYHVDHEIPFKGKLVSGLHVENNLRYLTYTENLVKGNTFSPYTIKDGEITLLPKEFWAE